MGTQLTKYDKRDNFSVFDSKSICVYDNQTGLLKGVEVEVELSLLKKHMWGMKSFQLNKKTNKWAENVEYKVSAEGYDWFNKFAALRFIAPPRFDLNGITYTNPTIIRDKYGNKDMVMYMVSVAGRDATGSIYITPPTVVTFSQHEALMTALTGKVKKQADSDKKFDKDNALGFACPVRSKDKFLKTNDFYEFFPMSDHTGLIIDTSHKFYIETEAMMTAKKENIERTIVTVAKRNALRRHPAVSFYSLSPTRVKDKDGNTIDLVAKVKAMMWVGATDEELDRAIENYDFEGTKESVKYNDIEDGEVADDGSEIIIDEEVVVSSVEDLEEDTDEITEEIVEELDESDIKVVKLWINKHYHSVSKDEFAQFNVTKNSKLVQLMEVKDYIMRKEAEQEEAEMEELNNDNA